MPIDQMLVTITRPIEEAVNNVPGLQQVRSITSRGQAEVDLFFSWNVDMLQTLQLVNAAVAPVQPLLPPAAHLEARLVANSMAIAEREALSGAAPAQGILPELEELYVEGGEGEQGLMRRFARDLRIGTFEAGEPRERHAREILWRLTIAKLRNANPRFLNANGFS